MEKRNGKPSSGKVISASTIYGLHSKQGPFRNEVQFDLANDNSSSESEDCSSTIDEGFSSQRNPTNGNSSSENEDYSSTINEEFSSPRDPVQCNPAYGNSSSDNEYSSSTMDEEFPSQRNPANGNSSPESEDSSSSTDEDDPRTKEEALKREKKFGLRRCYPIVWTGELFLGKLRMEIMIKYISGDTAISRAALPSPLIIDPVINIRMKLSFDGFPQRHTKRLIQAKKESCVLIALPIGQDEEQESRMEHQFIHYLRRKRVLGVAEFPQEANTKPKYKMLIFPPSDFVYNRLSKMAPILADSLYLNSYPHLLCLINPICYCFHCEETKRIHTRAK